MYLPPDERKAAYHAVCLHEHTPSMSIWHIVWALEKIRGEIQKEVRELQERNQRTAVFDAMVATLDKVIRAYRTVSHAATTGPSAVEELKNYLTSVKDLDESKPIPNEAMMFANGSLAVLDKNGTQIPELQVDVSELFRSYAKQAGYMAADTLVKVQGLA